MKSSPLRIIPAWRFSLSAANTDKQEFPATLRDRLVDSLAYAA